jgi:hydrophobe/amphiphile efflux-1 (HAE1) family protein
VSESEGDPAGSPAAYIPRNFFIRRPIFSAVLSIVIVLLGLFALQALPIAQYPRVTPPSVQVNAVYPGATAQDVAAAVAAPIEQQLSSLQGLLYFKSANSSDGSMNLSIYFDIDRDQDLAAVDVQNQVALATPQLPQEVRTNGVTVQKAQSDILLVAALVSSDPRYDAEYLSNYSKINIEDELKRLPGVGQAATYGQLEFSMLVSLDPARMAQLGVTVGDVANAIREQNATNPGGRIGREPAPHGTELTIPVTTRGRLTQPAEFENIIIRARPDGSLLRIGDLGRARLGARNYDLVGRVNGKSTAIIPVYLRSGANALQVKEEIVKRLDELSTSFPEGVSYLIPYDTTPFIDASIEEVVHTIFEALALVILVVFVFLQSWRTTIIPALAVPVSIVGTFFGMQLLGFSINSLTLFGLVLAIGIVVDDAIVVIENVERIMAAEHVSPAEAADKAMGQVSGALVAIVLVLCAVFIPVAFLGGITGALYKQFAITIVISVVLSGIVALTLTPALCALLLKPHDPSRRENRFFAAFNRVFGAATSRYEASVGGILHRPRTFLAAFAVAIALAVLLFQRIPRSFLPSEDKGYFAAAIQLPDAASIQRTNAVIERVEQILLADPGVKDVVVLAGLDIILGANQTNSATLFATLKPWGERTGRDLNLPAIVQRANRQFAGIREALVFAFNFPEIPGLGTTSGLELNLQDRGIGDIQKFAGVVGEVTQALNEEPAIAGARPSIKVNVPQIYVEVDRPRVKALGLSLTDVFQTLQAMLSTLYVNDFNLYGKTYRVQLEAEPQFRVAPTDIGQLFVRGPQGAMIPISAVSQQELRGGPSLVTRFNGFTSALVTAGAKQGRSSGEVLSEAEAVARRYADRGIGYGLSGQSLQEKLAGGKTAIVFGLGIIMVFLILAAQYESWSIPFAVILGVPFGLLGALLALLVRGLPNDVYFTIGLVTVVGLAAKNAILIVEFANELRAQGKSLRDAAMEAARERFRPILMTSFAFILGVVPLVIASGAGAGARNSLGTGVFGGMLLATLIGIFFIPLFFHLIASVSERFGKRVGSRQS